MFPAAVSWASVRLDTATGLRLVLRTQPRSLLKTSNFNPQTSERLQARSLKAGVRAVRVNRLLENGCDRLAEIGYSTSSVRHPKLKVEGHSGLWRAERKRMATYS